VSLQLLAEFTRMTKQEYGNNLKHFWIASRVDIALRKLTLDKEAGVIATQALTTNVEGIV